MILTIEIGNRNIVICIVQEGRRLYRCALAARTERTADELALTLEQLCRRGGAEAGNVSGTIIASVVPQLTDTMLRAVKLCTGKAPLLLGPGLKTGLNIRMDDPTELGGSLAAAVAVLAGKRPLPCAIVYLGTATAIGVLDRQGRYIGGVICPGLDLSRESLAKGASQLTEVSLTAPGRVIGKNTRDCVRSGVVYGSAAMLDGILERIETELQSPVSVVVTGEGADLLVPHCRRSGDMEIDDDLIMRGLWTIYRRNREE